MRFSILFLVIAACNHTEKTQPAPSASVTASTTPSASASASAAPLKNEWSGTYTSQAATIFVPDGGEWAGVKFRGEDASDGLGTGTLKIAINDGIVSGEGDGALGSFTIAGSSSENVITFVVKRKDPKDMSFTGTGRATIDKDKVEGSLRVSKATGNVIREAAFSLQR
jgi:hypothetical protein